jgi:hypothetical protein
VTPAGNGAPVGGLARHARGDHESHDLPIMYLRNFLAKRRTLLLAAGIETELGRPK